MIIRSIDRKNLEKEITADEHRLSSIDEEISDLEWEKCSLSDKIDEKKERLVSIINVLEGREEKTVLARVKNPIRPETEKKLNFF